MEMGMLEFDKVVHRFEVLHMDFFKLMLDELYLCNRRL